MKRPWCKGASQLAHPLRPSSLVTCPECGRPNLNGEEPMAHGYTTPESYDDANGEYRMAVPQHREGPRAKEWQTKQAERANAKSCPPDYQCSPNCSVCQ